MAGSTHGRAELLDVIHGLVVDFLNHVTTLQTALRGVAIRIDSGHDDSAGAGRQIELFGDIGRQVFDL